MVSHDTYPKIMEGITMTSPDKPEHIGDEELRALICECVDLLLPTIPPGQAEVVRAIDVEGASLRSISGKLGLSIGEAESVLAQGRQSVKDRFGEMNKICTEHGLTGCNCNLKDDPETKAAGIL